MDLHSRCIFSLQEGLSLGVLPVSRFLLATLGILTTEHRANSVSLLLNSGVLALTQTVLRLIGEARSFLDIYIFIYIFGYVKLKLCLYVAFFSPLFEPFKNGFNTFLWSC